MSLNTIPALGKSTTSRICSAKFIFGALSIDKSFFENYKIYQLIDCFCVVLYQDLYDLQNFQDLFI
jgi:hypothetical protein